jgi:hypothetical protein
MALGETNMKITEFRRACAGYYNAFTDDPDTCFNIVQRENDRQWYFVNAYNAYEGGDDLFPTLKAAREALESYLDTRYWNTELRCYCCK